MSRPIRGAFARDLQACVPRLAQRIACRRLRHSALRDRAARRFSATLSQKLADAYLSILSYPVRIHERTKAAWVPLTPSILRSAVADKAGLAGKSIRLRMAY